MLYINTCGGVYMLIVIVQDVDRCICNGMVVSLSLGVFDIFYEFFHFLLCLGCHFTRSRGRG